MSIPESASRIIIPALFTQAISNPHIFTKQKQARGFETTHLFSSQIVSIPYEKKLLSL
jgi:hypothetical protein